MLTVKKGIENVTWEHIKDELPIPSSRASQFIAGTSEQNKEKCQVDHKRQPDVIWVGEDRFVSLEVDEDSHYDREISCELAKIDETRWGVEDSHKPHIMIRFNPNAFDKRTVHFEDRCKELAQLLKHVMTCSIHKFDVLRCNVIYMYYHTKAYHHIQAAKDKPETINVLQIIE